MSRVTEDGDTAILDALIDLLTADHSATQARKLSQFGRLFLRHVPADELKACPAKSWILQVNHLFALLDSRIAGETVVRIENLPPDEGGPAHTMVTVIGDDRPFLVDSTTLAIVEMGLTIHLVVHPIVHVVRDEGGYLMEFSGDAGHHKDSHPESLIFFQIDRQTDPDVLAALQKKISDHLEDVSLAVSDWWAMLERVEQVCEELMASEVPYHEDNVGETIDFLRWLADRHFTFLGYRQYDIVREEGGGAHLSSKDDSALGILRSDHRSHPDRTLVTLPSLEPRDIARSNPIVLTKTNSKATVHRGGYMDYVGVMIFDDAGKLVGEHRFLGLYASAAYNRRPWNIPIVRRKVAKVMERSGFPENSHGGKAMHHTMETLPRDELFQANSDELYRLVKGVFNLQERQKTRLLVRTDQFGRFYSCLVFIPRERFNTENRQNIQSVLLEAFDGDHLDYTVQVSESALARLHVIIRVPRRKARTFDIPAIEAQLVEVTRSWHDRLKDILVDKFGEETGLQWANTIGRSFPAAYIEDVSPWVAAFDVENVALLQSDEDLRMSLYRPRVGQPGVFRFKVFRVRSTIPLSDILPMLENMGLRVVSERPYRLQFQDESLRWIQDFDMELAGGGGLDPAVVKERFQTAFEKTVRGEVENDGFNRLILAANLSWREVSLLRTYCKYLLQTGNPFSQSYIEMTLTNHPGIARLIVELFQARFDPDRDDAAVSEAADLWRQSLAVLLNFDDDRVGADLFDELIEARGKDRRSQQDCCRALLMHCLDSVSSLDDDRILRAYIETVWATLRTNYYQPDSNGEPRPYISVKLDSCLVPDLPEPRPWREIFVYSPRVEGVHLRGGSVARGGLRWSDRREDFRTEILGLMKAQVVKNTLIVPVGAKGGFYVKRLPPPDDRKVMMAEVVACYRIFINGLLDITDNLAVDQVIHPRQVVRHDADDPYLVVAADKGTATFSDIANSVSERHEYWLGDAFASGGSVGYDHKGMGITARGAWESVKRHFRQMGKDCQSEPFTVVGIGDMSGDVFGNGMLLSKQIRLQAAFNHQHIFIDPDPDPAASFIERKRIFELERSSWEDYNHKLISSGGGVFSRREKTIKLSPEIKQWLSIRQDALSPTELIHQLIKGPVDLLWNGGIGTYVKSSKESHSQVGDRSNDGLRVDGRDLRCKVVGEGGNLGFSQLGRIEYALAGGRINTDFIDNSAGVDCSDHEVNIKILLNQLVASGSLELDARNRLLASMTDEVAELVLRNNYLQSQALSVMEALTVPRLGSKAHLIDVLSSQGILDRELEFLPDDEQLSDRKAKGIGLTRPELAVLLSYSKITLYRDLLGTDVPEDPYLSRELVRYFPGPLQTKYSDQMEAHRLRREIIVTAVTNSMVNRMGATFCLRMHEDTGASSAQIAKAYTAAREIFSAREWWDAIEARDNRVSSEHQIEALLMIWNLLRHATRWMLANFRGSLDIAALVERFGDGVSKVVSLIPKVASPVVGKRVASQRRRFVKAGFESRFAKDLASIHGMSSALDIIEVAKVSRRSVSDVAKVYFQLDHKMKLSWLMNEVLNLKVEGQWHANARGVMREELFRQHRELTANVIGEKRSKPDDLMKIWSSHNQEQIAFLDHMLADMKADGSMDYAKVSVAIRGLEQLVMGTR